MAHFVQIMHPGPEPVVNGNRKPWNQGLHRRCFLQSTGTALTATEETVQANLVFWGEWESPASVRPLKGTKVGLPTQLFVPTSEPCPEQGTPQNTDPFVFGDEFLYCCCYQVKKDGTPTYLSKLERGDVILFGSNLEHLFVLDTVFVVNSCTDYDPRNWTASLGKNLPDAFVQATLKPLELAFRGKGVASDNKSLCTEKSWSKEDQTCTEGCVPCDVSPRQYRLYRGATINNRVGDMFSFVPAMILSDPPGGFARPSLNSLEFVINDLPFWGGCRVNVQDYIGPWNKVKEAVLAQGLLLGVQFELPKPKKTTQI